MKENLLAETGSKVHGRGPQPRLGTGTGLWPVRKMGCSAGGDRQARELASFLLLPRVRLLPAPLGPKQNCLPQNRSLVPKTLGTAGTEAKSQPPVPVAVRQGSPYRSPSLACLGTSSCFLSGPAPSCFHRPTLRLGPNQRPCHSVKKQDDDG